MNDVRVWVSAHGLKYVIAAPVIFVWPTRFESGFGNVLIGKDGDVRPITRDEQELLLHGR
jgi:hypothetical protein